MTYMLNILLHGASVTQQEYETSYFWHLKELSLGEDFSLRKKGMGVVTWMTQDS